MKKGKEETKKKEISGIKKSKSFFTDERIRFVGGILVTGFAIYLLFAFIAYLFYWKQDQSQIITGITDPSVQAKNWSGKSGAWFAELIICKGFGLGAFLSQ